MNALVCTSFAEDIIYTARSVAYNLILSTGRAILVDLFDHISSQSMSSAC
jgi:hypothetical protein